MLRKASHYCALLGGLLFATAAPAQESQAQESQAQESQAQERAPKWLQWEAPPECPSGTEIDARLKEWLQKPPDFKEDLHVKASATAEGARWRVLLDLSYGDDIGRREVTLDSCAEAGDFVALTVALAVKPNLHNTTDDSSPLSPAPVAPVLPLSTSVEAEPAASFPSGPETSAQPDLPLPPLLEATSQRDKPSEKDAPPRGSMADDPEATPTSSIVPQSNSSRERPWFLGAALAIAWGPLPSYALGPAVSGGRKWGPWRGSLGAFYFPGSSYEFSGAENDVSMSFVGAELQACHLLTRNRWSFGPCVSTQLAAIPAQEQLSDEDRAPRGGTGLWAAFLLGAEGSLKLAPPVEGFLAADWLIPVLRPEFSLADASSSIFQSRMGFQGKLGLRIFF